MDTVFRNYLCQVRARLHLKEELENQLISELSSHFYEKTSELKKQGLSDEEAAKKAIESFGAPEEVAQLLYEACSKGSMKDALKLSTPHFIVAALFASGLLHNFQVVLPAFGVVLVVAVSGWWRGRPDWLYSWIGYALMPLFAGVFLLLPVIQQVIMALFYGGSLPATGLLIGAVAFFLMALWIILTISVQVIRRDWLIASLMLAPVPIIACWLFHMHYGGGILGGSEFVHLNQPIAQALMVLGFTSVLFIRLRQRIIKTGVIITVSIISMMMIGQSFWGDIGFFGLMGLSLVSLTIFILPAITEALIGQGEPLSDRQ